MKTAIIATLIASAAAFAPAKQAATSTALNMAFEGELGAQPPLGFFDPIGIAARSDVNNFERLRYVEIKHGRICMLAVVGYLVTAAGIRLPGDIALDGTKFADIPAGFDALSAIPDSGKIQTIGFIGFLELFVMKDIANTGNEHVGDFRNGALDYGWDTFDEETKLQKRAIELNQGRAAQMGILALMVHEKLGVSLIPSL
ncbi:Fucoxanthin-chlorophyll a-c binding protein [Seminavis robusta]|uniref:Fucoxanthin-chlorophyll a-c binding protein n=1 Tax=Seminavis robusta TaxID=568900 RepID=A0A9N8H6Y0_9STRA|nr:Fucoxanthin-chlorophyll a-c binding protein [Seminavis robusta]|eukprot:Sro125_g060100.1 Fucoxanthin-chlorophyll a-c binding protein (200) ;mRNA; r:18955-19554